MTALAQRSRADRSLCAATARLLAAAASAFGTVGVGCAGLAAWALLGAGSHGLAAGAAWAVLSLLPVERVLAFRLQLDAGLFADLHRAAADAQPGSPTPLQALDQALQALGLRRQAVPERALAPRVEGARRLLAWHGVAVAAQFGALSLCIARI